MFSMLRLMPSHRTLLHSMLGPNPVLSLFHISPELQRSQDYTFNEELSKISTTGEGLVVNKLIPTYSIIITNQGRNIET